MTLHIAVCDDEAAALNRTKQFLSAYNDAEIFEFTSFSQIVDFKDKIDIAFLDMKFGDNSGFDVAEHLKKINPDCIITFFTNYAEFMKQSFEYRAFRYILKEEPSEFIKKQIDDTINEYYENNSLIAVSYKNKLIYVDLNNIEYIEMINHTAHIQMENGDKHLWYNTLENILKKLTSAFIRCSRSYIINLNMIKLFSNTHVVMESGASITIGRNYKKAVIEAINNFEKRNI